MSEKSQAFNSEQLEEPDKITASQALWGFAAWLTTLEKPLVVGARYPAGDLAELVDAFCKANGLSQPGSYNYVTPEDPRKHA